jgi:hypothetical protein
MSVSREPLQRIQWLVCAALIVVLLAIFAAGCGFGNHYDLLSTEVGPLGTLKLEDLWIHVVNARGLAADNETVQSLEMDFSANGLLLHFYLQARTYDDKLLSAGYEAFGLPSLATRKVMVGGSLDSLAASLPDTGVPVGKVMAALDKIGPLRILSQLGTVGPSGYYSTHLLLEQGGSATVTSRAPVYAWNGTSFSSLAANDTRRTYDSHYLYVAVNPMVPAPGESPAAIEGTPTAVGHESLPPSFFLIPL